MFYLFFSYYVVCMHVCSFPMMLNKIGVLKHMFVYDYDFECAIFIFNGYGVQKDGRIPSHSGYKWKVNSDVESLAWDPHTEYSFVVCASCFFVSLKFTLVV